MLPSAMSGLTSLTKLSLDGSMVGNWPASIGSCAAVRSGAPTAAVGGQAEQQLQSDAIVGKVRHLSLTDTGLRALPSCVASLTALVTLNLSTNLIAALPEIAHLRALTYLSAAHNHLSCVPDAVGRLSALKELHLAHNHIIVVSPALFTLSKLQVLLPVSADSTASLGRAPPVISSLPLLSFSLLSCPPPPPCLHCECDNPLSAPTTRRNQAKSARPQVLDISMNPIGPRGVPRPEGHWAPAATRGRPASPGAEGGAR